MNAYFQPRSLTWWAGVGAVTIGLADAVLPLTAPEAGPLVRVAAEVVGALAGTESSPAALILLGLGLIGLRAKLERLAEREK
jgi:hypothetical protein